MHPTDSLLAANIEMHCKEINRERTTSNIFTLFGFTQHEKDRGSNVGGNKDHSDTETIKLLVYPHLCPGSPRCVVRVYTLTRNNSL